MKIGGDFFLPKTERVAQELLGKILVRKLGEKTLSGIITETEAYIGPHDLACHAAKGRTPRTDVMFRSAGTWYVYLVYGMYHCLNIVTEAKDYPAAVLIRAIKPIKGIKSMIKNRKLNLLKNNLSQLLVTSDQLPITNGPGKLCQALRIDKRLNGTSAVAKGARLYIEDRGIKITPNQIARSKRIGVDYAKNWKDKLLRFSLITDFLPE
ncbi:MAG: DNA-3-methyladenine glycosylase [Candidatus Moranbacteria bacterium]|nr:DNA-3-methyladenine glycosylase [Candidatus Moranbacteria bacterium]